MTIALLAITDDPQGKQLPHFDSSIFSLFDSAYLISSQETSRQLIDKLSPHCLIRIRPKEGMCQARRDVLALAWAEEAGADRYFYCDFDRLLFWYAHFRIELEHILSVADPYPFTIFGRTQTAIDTYPELQRVTERAMNRVVKLRLDMNYDFFAGARMFSPGFSRMLIKCNGEAAQLDVAWPLVVQRSGAKLNYIGVDGLGYEAEFLGMEREFIDEIKLRCLNLKSILDFVDWNVVEV